MLWDIELHNRKISESQGFDEFIGYALACTIPLLCTKAVAHWDSITKEKHMKSIEYSFDHKKTLSLFTTFLSIGGGFFTYSYMSTEFFKSIGLDEDISIVFGVILGGIIGSAAMAYKTNLELNHLLRASCSGMSKSDILGLVISSLEGIWFSLPTITVANRAMEESNLPDLLKNFLLIPLTLVTFISESKDIFEGYINFKNI